MKRNNAKNSLPDHVTALESNLFQLVLILLAGGFAVLTGLLGIIAALLALPR